MSCKDFGNYNNNSKICREGCFKQLSCIHATRAKVEECPYCGKQYPKLNVPKNCTECGMCLVCPE